MILNKIFFPLLLLTLLVIAALWAQVRQNAKLELRIDAYEEIVKSKNLLIAKERTMAFEASVRAAAYQELRRKSHEEIERINRCIADKSCVPRVRVQVACPAGLPTTGSNAGGTEIATVELGPDDARMVIQIREAAKLMHDRYLWMQKELIARSDPKYCQPK